MSEEDEPDRPFGCGAAIVITIVVAAPILVLYRVTPTGFVLGVNAIVWGAVIWAARTKGRWVLDAPNPAPPPVPEGVVEEKPQVKIVKDPNHVSRWEVVVDQGKQGRT